MDGATVLVNGSPDERIEAGDRGFTLGDGVFETIAVRGGQPLRWPAHLERLAIGCRRLYLPVPDPDELGRDRDRVIAPGSSGVLRITVSRGSAGRGYALPPAGTEPTRVVAFSPLAGGLPAATPIAVRTCGLRLAVQPALAGIKHLNRLEQILARAEWSDPAIEEGLLYDKDGALIEATASNVFLVRAGQLATPRLDRCGVAGVLRAGVLAAAAELGIDCTIGRLGRDDVVQADEVFVANSLFAIRPVRAVDDRMFAAPGRVTRSLAGRIDGLGNFPYRTE